MIRGAPFSSAVLASSRSGGSSCPVADQHPIHLDVGHREDSRDLAHERLGKTRHRPEDSDPPRSQLDYKDRVERDQAPPRPAFGREQVQTSDLSRKCLLRFRTLRHGWSPRTVRAIVARPARWRVRMSSHQHTDASSRAAGIAASLRLSYVDRRPRQSSSLPASERDGRNDRRS
jgi:hypothetical protein